MPLASQRDISTRHFPEISDTSFQIPSFQDNTGGLLCENQLGGLELDATIDYPFNEDGSDSGMNIDPFSTPLPRAWKYNSSPLRLSEITPRRKREAAAMAEHQVRQHENGTGAKTERGENGEKETLVEKTSSVRLMLPKKRSVDDMFERRKRDNYQQMGIDLSFKSTARLRRDTGEIQRPDNTTSKPSAISNVAVKRQPKTSGHEVSDAPKTTAGKPKPKRPVIDKDAGIAKHKSRVVASTTQPKSILKPSQPSASALPPSTLTRTLTTASHTPQAERPKWGDVVAEVQQTSHRRESIGSGIAAIGGGLIDVLVMYGEKLKGSLGFSSASKPSTPKAKNVSANAQSQLSTDAPRDEDPTSDVKAGPSSRPLKLSDLSPFRSSRRKGDVLTLSDLSPSKNNTHVDKEIGIGKERPTNMSPKPQSRKRTLTETSSHESKKSKFNPEAPMAPIVSSRPISKREKITRTGPKVSQISKPQPLGSSRVVNKATTLPRHKSQPVRVTENDHRLGTATSAPDLKGKSIGKSSGPILSRRDNRKEQQPLGSHTLPPGPAFASDVYRQRALEKTQKESERREAREKAKRNFKAGLMPYFSKPAPPARPAVRPTIPAAFTFHSDARVAQRNAGLEEKRKTWESHATHQALPMPDFATIHAAQAETLRSRKVVPVLPTDAPALTTMVRAKEREKFEAERRERERTVEEQLEMRERERAEQEEKEYREARKRTVPKAHEVPDWYKDSRRRKATT